MGLEMDQVSDALTKTTVNPEDINERGTNKQMQRKYGISTGVRLVGARTCVQAPISFDKLSAARMSDGPD